MRIPHIGVLKDLCASQKTMTTSRLSKELKRIEGQVNSKTNKMRTDYQARIAELNARAQKAEAVYKTERTMYIRNMQELNLRAQKAEAELQKYKKKNS